MSPLLSTRPSGSVVRRLAGTCAVIALLAVLVALSAGEADRPSGAAPSFLTVGAVCAALLAYLLHASARAVEDQRLRWVAAACGIACLGLLGNLFGQPTVFPDGGPVTQGADAMSARYLIWHGALAIGALVALGGAVPSRARLIAFVAPFLALLAWSFASSAPFGDLAGDDGYRAGLKVAVALLVLAEGGAAAAWWRVQGRVPAWGAMCVIAALALSAADALAYLFATEPYAGAWWASLTLRTGQFLVPVAGLALGLVGLADRLRDLQREMSANFTAEHERAAREEALAGAGRARREALRGAIQRLIGGVGLDVALQPIVDLDSGRIIGAEALARFTGADGQPIPTEACFLDAHALGLGEELELAAIRLALASHDRLPEGLYLALNASPGLVSGDELLAALLPHERRPLVVELTEHQPVEDYVALAGALDRLREHGVRVAIDDVGSGFSSFRHVTRVNPEILKLDRTLVCGIDDDPVRQSLAAAIVSFAHDVGATVVSEGIESEAELECLRELEVGCGQGFLLGRPNLGTVAAPHPEPVA